MTVVHVTVRDHVPKAIEVDPVTCRAATLKMIVTVDRAMLDKVAVTRSVEIDTVRTVLSGIPVIVRKNPDQTAGLDLTPFTDMLVDNTSRWISIGFCI